MHIKRQLEADPVLDDIRQPDVPAGPDTLAAAMALIDHGLVTLAYRQIATSDEVSDLLLDLRVVLLVAELEAISRQTPAAA
jgi:hypothetical protein